MGENSKILKSTITVTLVGGLAQIVGFFIPVLIAKYFGVSEEVDAYYFAISIPNLVIGIIIGGSIKIIFIPLYIKERRENPANINSFVAQVSTFLLVLSLAIAGVILLMVQLDLLRVLSQEKTTLLINRYILYTIPLIPVTVIFQLYNAIYNSHQRFALLEVTNLVKYFFTVLFVFFFHTEYGILSAVIGQILGQTIALVLAVLILKVGLKIDLGFSIRFQKAYMKLLQMSSLALGAFVFAQLTPFFLKIIAAMLPLGSISIIGYSERLSIIPSFILGSSFSVILTSYWSKYFVNNEAESLKESFNKTVSALFVILFPVTIGLSFLSEEVVTIIFLRGSFDAETVVITASVFGLFIIQIIPSYYNNVLSRILHINQDLKYLFSFSALAFVLNTLLMFYLAIHTSLGILGIPLGLVIGRILSVLVNTFYVHKKYVEFHVKTQLFNLLKIVIATTLMICSIILKRSLLVSEHNYIVNFIVDVLLGFVVYVLVLKAIKHSEFNALLIILKKKLFLR